MMRMPAGSWARMTPGLRHAAASSAVSRPYIGFGFGELTGILDTNERGGSRARMLQARNPAAIGLRPPLGGRNGRRRSDGHPAPNLCKMAVQNGLARWDR